MHKGLLEFQEYVKDLSMSDTVMQMDNYMQHGDITTLEHVIAVSYTAFLLAKKWNADVRSAVRGPSPPKSTCIHSCILSPKEGSCYVDSEQHAHDEQRFARRCRRRHGGRA